MPLCDLGLTLDRPDATHKAGDEMSGHVDIRAQDDLDCRGIRVTLRWRTDGWSNTDKGDAHERDVVGPFSLPRGHSKRCQFSLAVPPGPPSYRGKNFQVAWYLEARADFPMQRDVKTERAVPVAPGESSGVTALGPRFRPRREHRSRRIFLYVIAVAIGIDPLVFGVWPYFTAASHAWYHYLALLVGGVLTVFGLRGIVAARRLGRVSVHLDREQARPGGEVPFTVRITPRGDLEIQTIGATLRAVEWARRGSGKHSSVRTHDAHVQHAELASGSLLDRGHPAAFEGSFSLPIDAPATFVATQNRVQWWLKIHVAITGWPDWSAEYPVVVTP